MSTESTPAKIGNKARRVWKSAQMYLAFHKDQNKRQRKEPKLWPPKNGSASLHGDTTEQETVVVVKSADPAQTRDVEIKMQPNRIVMRREAAMWWQAVAVYDDAVAVRMPDGLVIEIRHDGSVKRRSTEDETHVEADGSIIKWTPHAESTMTGDGIEMSRRTEGRIAAITHDGVVDRARK